MEQPTNEQLQTAMRIAKIFSGTQQAGDTLSDLRRLRDRRTTWCGKDELSLRRQIDEYLEGGGGGFCA